MLNNNVPFTMDMSMLFLLFTYFYLSILIPWISCFFFSLAPLTFEILRSDCSNSEKKISCTLDIFTVRRHVCKFSYI